MESRGSQRLALLGGVAALMVLPVVALRAAESAAWDPGDAVFLAILLAGVGLAHELAARARGGRAYAVGLGIAVAAALLQAWINLAVGIVGNEDNPVNLIYAGVIAVAALGALIARLRPAGMAVAMTAAAAAQALTFVAAIAGGLGFTGPITIFFAALWLLAAWAFRKAARDQPGTAP